MDHVVELAAFSRKHDPAVTREIIIWLCACNRPEVCAITACLAIIGAVLFVMLTQ
jgi:uncharacterized membrane protein (DUF373 family)